MLGEKKEKIPFGRRPSKGSFGKKPSKPLKSRGFKIKDNNSLSENNKKDLFGHHNRIKDCVNQKQEKRNYLRKRSNRNKLENIEKEFMQWLTSGLAIYPCFVCGKQNGIEWHHVKKYSTDAKNNKRLIPLCGVEHHRLGTTISPHGTPKKWRETFTMEEQNALADKVFQDFLIYRENI